MAALDRARAGDSRALEELLLRNRECVERAVALRWERRMDPADVLQEVSLEAFRRFEEYLASSPLLFHLWLRLLARDKLRDLRRKHLGAAKRDGRRKAALPPLESSMKLVQSLAGKGPTPSRALAAKECAELLRAALSDLDPDERDILLWRHFEFLTNGEVARLLGIGEAAASKRYIRALERLRGILAGMGMSGAEY
jgi:RNA polymerase sigma-70 factor, ECF subfamily